MVTDLQDEVEDRATRMALLASTDIEGFKAKALEYGSADLEVMGSAMSQILDCDQGDGVEAALAFYALGKVARAFGAMAQGKMPSDDTWHDLTVYSLMIRERRLGASDNVRDLMAARGEVIEED